jgi:hypothetical protein
VSFFWRGDGEGGYKIFGLKDKCIFHLTFHSFVISVPSVKLSRCVMTTANVGQPSVLLAIRGIVTPAVLIYFFYFFA